MATVASPVVRSIDVTLDADVLAPQQKADDEAASTPPRTRPCDNKIQTAIAVTGFLIFAAVIPILLLRVFLDHLDRGGSKMRYTYFYDGDIYLAPSDARLAYTGRFEISDDEAVSGWPGTSIAVNVTTQNVSAVIGVCRGGARFVVEVDGVANRPFTVEPGFLGPVVLVNNLTTYKPHVVRLIKVSEDAYQEGTAGAVSFQGFRMPPNTTVYPVALKARRLEFIGDSDTVGYCAADHGNDDTTERRSSNTYVTWHAQLARALDAEEQVQAISGVGILDWSIAKYLNNTLPFCSASKGALTADDDGGGDDDGYYYYYYDDAYYYDDDDRWSGGNYGGPKVACTDWSYNCSNAPDAVVILIGPNDSSEKTAKFKSAYVDFLKYFAAVYKECSVTALISVCGGSINGFDPCEVIQEATAAFNDDYPSGIPAHYTSMKRSTWEVLNAENSPYLGCDEHYNERGFTVLMEEIKGNVTEILGW